MNAGRELDALVASKVMGWRVLEQYDNYHTDTDHNIAVLHPEPIGLMSYWNTEVKYYSLRPWHPSTDIAAAWQVVEHLIRQNVHIDIGTTVRGSLADVRAGIKHIQWNVTTRGQGLGARCDTAPHAICLAALRAVGVEVEA